MRIAKEVLGIIGGGGMLIIIYNIAPKKSKGKVVEMGAVG